MINLNDYRDGDYLTNHNSQIYVKTIGSGSPMLVVHGGPGLDHTYLVRWFGPLAKLRTFIFFDQVGCGRDLSAKESASLHENIRQMDSLVSLLGSDEGIGFFAHSWGALLTLSYLLEHPSAKTNEVVLCSPQALTSELSAEAASTLVSRMPPDVVSEYKRLVSLSSRDSNRLAMQTILPYYVGTPNSPPDLEFGFYDPNVEQKVNETIETYDIRHAAKVIPQKTLLVYGELDFERPENTAELQNPSTRLVVIPNAGHFSFAESPQVFQETMLEFLDQ